MRLSLPRLRMPRVPGFGLLAWLFAALKGWVMASRDKDADSLIMYDRTLLWLTFGLAAIGFVMVTSASMPVGQRLRTIRFCLPNVMRSISSWHFVWRWSRYVCP